jgi:hypothetical protein
MYNIRLPNLSILVIKTIKLQTFISGVGTQLAKALQVVQEVFGAHGVYAEKVVRGFFIVGRDVQTSVLIFPR